MARDSTGKWVQRAGSTGGGRTYRGQMPVNWYAALVIICVLGIASIVLARYQNQNSTTASTTPPTTKQTWYAGEAYDICGTQQPALASNAATAKSGGFYTAGEGVITIAPVTAAQAGTNATFGKFVDNYKGLTVTQDEVQLPGGAVYKNGAVCAKGTPDAGKTGEVQVVSWSNALKAHVTPVTVSGDPGALLFTQNQLITVAFAPSGAKIPRPSGTVVSALLQASLQTSTSTSLPTTATVPSTTATTAGSTASTTASTPTTTATTTTPTTAKATSTSTTAAKSASSSTTSPKS